VMLRAFAFGRPFVPLHHPLSCLITSSVPCSRPLTCVRAGEVLVPRVDGMRGPGWAMFPSPTRSGHRQLGCSTLSVLASADVHGASPVCAWAFVLLRCLLSE
jgi:hypothetical protein